MTDQESTDTAAPADSAPEAQATTSEPTPQQTFDADYVAKLRAENARYRTTAKENAEKAKRLDELEEASKSETEKLAAKLAAAEQRAQAAELAALRAEIAQDKGVPATLLAGSTQEELAASAEALLAFRGQPPAAPAADYGRASDSAAPASRPAQLTRSDLKRMTPEQIVAAEDAGQLDDLKAGRIK